MPETSLTSRSPLTRATPLLLVAAVALLAIMIINPFREFLGGDDSWFYARMVQHLLATGKYQTDAFSVASPPVQIYLAAGLAKLFGYSLILLRLIELAFLAMALARLLSSAA